MKNNRYRRLRAAEMSNRDFLAGKTAADSPFPLDSLEHRTYAQAMAQHTAFHQETRDMFGVYGHGDKMPRLKSPDTVVVRPALPGFP